MNVNGLMDLPGWANGLVVLPWWGYILAALLLTHITIAAVTIYLHRYSAHRALDLHPVVSHFFRAWLWLTTGMSTKAWTAIHRKHHAKCETEEDPHSPQILSLKKVLLEGSELAVTVQASTAQKCERCWHYRGDVGADATHPTLCGRCTSNLFGAGEPRKAA